MLDRYFVVIAHWILEFHLPLPRAIDRQHRHPSPEKVVAINMQFFLDRIQARDEDHHWGLGSVPGLPQDAIHRGSPLVGDSHMLAGKIEEGQRSLVVAYDVLVRNTQFMGLAHKQILPEV